MDEKKVGLSQNPRRARTISDVRDMIVDYIKIFKIVVKMTEEERCDFFDWWHHQRHVERNVADIAKRGFRDFARKVGVME